MNFSSNSRFQNFYYQRGWFMWRCTSVHLITMHCRLCRTDMLVLTSFVTVQQGFTNIWLAYNIDLRPKKWCGPATGQTFKKNNIIPPRSQVIGQQKLHCIYHITYLPIYDVKFRVYADKCLPREPIPIHICPPAPALQAIIPITSQCLLYTWTTDTQQSKNLFIISK